MKKTYEKPEILVIEVTEKDIVTTSTCPTYTPGGCTVELTPVP